MEFSLENIKGVGPKTLSHLRHYNIWSTYDLVLRYPKKYEDFTLDDFHNIKHKDVITVTGKIVSALESNPYARVHLTRFIIELLGKRLEVVAFNRPYLAKQFFLNDEVVIQGTYHFYQKQIVAKAIVKKEKNVEIKPIYQLNPLYDRHISQIVKTIFEEKQVQIYENLLAETVKKYHLPSRYQMFQMLHLPSSFTDVQKARERFKYEEAFFLQLQLKDAFIKRQTPRVPIAYDLQKVKTFIERLPYELTQDQKNAVNDIYRDFKKNYANARLIQGDVGSGKTLVVAVSCLPLFQNKRQVVLMAPTELLATQHYQYFQNLFQNEKIALLTSQTKNKKAMKEDIEKGVYSLIIGTHALVEPDVKFHDLGLIVIDEQHKFGVETRDTLIQKAKTKDILYLTATPIPRTLAMLAYGEANVSIIKEKPKARQKVQTTYLLKNDLTKLYDQIRITIAKKEHIFVVVPAITSTHVSDNIETVYALLRENLNASIYMLHGQQTAVEQTTQMEQFMNQPGSILLATTMIEVGIDIPTATLIAIFGAEHFGLSQLHQLRGRVGRSERASQCFVVSEKEDVERLQVLTETDDGFKLSNFDLIQRGPGDFLGVDQSGYFNFAFLDILTDQKILTSVAKDVDELLQRKDFATNPKYRYLHRILNKDNKI